MRRFSALDSSLTVYSGRLARGAPAAGAVSLTGGISVMRRYDTRAGAGPRHSPWKPLPFAGKGASKNPLPPAGEGRVRVRERRRMRIIGALIAQSPHPYPLPQAGEGEAIGPSPASGRGRSSGSLS